MIKIPNLDQARFFFITLLLTISLNVSGQTTLSGRISTCDSLPLVKPNGFSSSDFMYVKKDSTTWMWQLGWYKAPIRLSAKDGTNGKDGVCPSCPPSSGGAVQNFGTVKWVSNESELRAAFEGYGNGTTTCIQLTQDIAITQSLNFAKTVNSRSKKLLLYLNGNTIYDNSQNGLPYVIGRIALDQNEALNTMQDVAIIIRDGEIRGKLNTTTILDIASTYGSIIEGVDFHTGKEAVHLRFCLMAAVRNSLVNNISSEAMIADMGNWTGANSSNSQSNSSRFEQVRVFNNTGAKAGFSAYAASGMVWEQSISEGGNPKYNWLFDGKSSSVVKDGLIHLCHSENTPSVAHVEAAITEGVFQVDGLFHQYKGVLLSAISQGGYPHFYVKNIPYMVSGSTFKVNNNNCIMNFEEMPSTWTITTTTNWEGGIVPYYYQQKGLNQSPFWIGRGIKINTTNIN